LGSRKFEPVISVPVLLEYEEVLKRETSATGLSTRDIDDVLDFLCSVSRPQEIFYLWRPTLPDPDDDMILELAVAAQCEAIVTYNTAHYNKACGQFGIEVLTPQQFLKRLGVLP